MKTKTSSIAFMAILIAIMLLFGFTPIGYIPLPFAELTLMCLPVIIGTLVLGLRTGMGLSVVFILTSLLQLVIKPSVLALILLDANPALCVISLIVPRLLIPVVTYGVNCVLSRRMKRTGTAVACAAGSLINTFVYLGLLQLWFVSAIAAGFQVNLAGATGMIWGLVLTNGLPEAAIAAVVCPLIVRALQKSILPVTAKKEKATV